MRLTWQPFTLQLRNPFRLSYGVSDTRRVFWLRLTDGAGLESWGEAAIPPYYGVSDGAMTDLWADVNRRGESLPEDVTDIPAWVGTDGPAPARCALDLALHDRLGRKAGLPLWQFLGVPEPRPLATCFTIAIAEPAEMARLAAESSRFAALKIKLGSDDDFGRLAAVRAARPDARLRLDANAGWGRDEAVALIARLAQFDIELIEQPVAKDDIAGLGYVQAHTAIPVVADESCQTLADVEALASAGVRAINLKLMKAGGLGLGLAMLRRARELGLAVMLGCMVETSLGVTAMAHLAGLADWLDLDGPLLIANDPFEGLYYDERAGVHLPARSGIGVTLRAG